MVYLNVDRKKREKRQRSREKRQKRNRKRTLTASNYLEPCGEGQLLRKCLASTGKGVENAAKRYFEKQYKALVIKADLASNQTFSYPDLLIYKYNQESFFVECKKLNSARSVAPLISQLTDKQVWSNYQLIKKFNCNVFLFTVFQHTHEMMMWRLAVKAEAEEPPHPFGKKLEF